MALDSRMTRRHIVAAAGVAGAGFVAARTGLASLLDRAVLAEPAQAQTPACVLTGSRTEGPYFVDERLNRSDIRPDPTSGAVQAGVPLGLTFVVYDTDRGCASVQGAQVDVWHAGAAGLYSDEAANGTTGKKYLRGYQLTDAAGRAKFTTVYPGWYSGRAIHIHFKIRLFSEGAATTVFTSQVFFDDAVSDTVMAQAPYNTRGTRDTRNGDDGIYGSDGGKLTLTLAGDGNGGYAATFAVGLSAIHGSPSTTGGGSTGGGPDDKTVVADLSVARWARTKLGTRVLGLKLATYEPVKVTARLIRGSTVIARRQTGSLAAGSHTVKVAVAKRVGGGTARLKVTITDKAGNHRVVTRTVKVPRRRR
jgi:protocatechuate 3,4-dioxygenase beta subunit